MQSVHIAEHLPRFKSFTNGKAKREIVIIVAILLLGLIGMSTCIMDDTQSNEYTIQQISTTALTAK